MLWFLLCSKIITPATAGGKVVVLCCSSIPASGCEAVVTSCLKSGHAAHFAGKAEEEEACYTSLPLKVPCLGGEKGWLELHHDFV